MANWTINDIPTLTGKRVVITGATGGLGYETALALAGADAEVILTGRNANKGEEAVRRIRTMHPQAKLHFEALDLASLASVEAFSRTLNAEGQHIDLLINNAGVMSLPTRQITADGFEMQLGTNYLGHFALTARLLPLLRGIPHTRVVNLSSMAHRRGRIDLNDLQAAHAYAPWKVYAQSKLAMLMFALELQRCSDKNGWSLLSNAAHPGWARTDLIANGPGASGLMGRLARVCAPLFSQTAAAGALPTLYAATSPDAKASGYYGPNGFSELKGAPVAARIMPQAEDAQVAARLWDISTTLTGVSWESGNGGTAT